MWGEGVKKIFAVFQSAGVEIYVVGGAVRNSEMGLPVSDIDFAVGAAPDAMIKILKAHDISVIPTGLEHGTITALWEDESFEITAFRRDVETDGRHARTEFGGGLHEDAQRRDFTINALYLDEAGEVIDPLGLGLADLEARLLRFVGEARARIEEDHLRILRFFRFLSQYELTADPGALALCVQHIPMLEAISRERIGQEMRKLMAGAHACHALSFAAQNEGAKWFFPGLNLARLQSWQSFRESVTTARHWMVETVMASDEIPRGLWRLSNAETQIMKRLQSAQGREESPLEIGEIYGEESGYWVLLMQGFAHNRAPKADDFEALSIGATLEFPLSGHDLMALGLEGAAIGEGLEWLRARWRGSQYQLDKAALLALVSRGDFRTK